MKRLEQLALQARYNQWMNDKLYAAAASLPAEAVTRDTGAFFGSLLGTLNHIVVGDTLWLQRYAGHPAAFAALQPVQDIPRPASLDGLLFAELPALLARRQQLDHIIITLCAELQEAHLDVALPYHNTKGVAQRKNFHALLLHLFNHQTHHRGQATTLLTQLGAEVGLTDLLALIDDIPAA
ncbi:damage-inducible protein DinB [Aquitalea sp. FJL05]|uniref:DinB family protein n=1 Tax=Aquitalea sp. FJL05 TaxID=2153366 RepID=UPI000F5A1652|nr:DinB family protein [Aquitalea sp. FJL05]RQO77234.1 damage-inducible protein DinB [Aquitalea sp. FJL05]